MRKRNVQIQFRLTEKEMEKLVPKIKRSGLSREAYHSRTRSDPSEQVINSFQ